MSKKYIMLDRVNSPEELKALKDSEIPELCCDIRDFLVDHVERQGGHLASNLGITELSVAIHRIFDSPRDHIIFDVGHQSYVHKILTGRKGEFENLRRTGGLSGFTSMRESAHDAFGAGHSSTSISAALGYAESDKLNGSDAYTVAVIGDGAYTGGMVHEALNNCSLDTRLIIIINENGMSISQNKGAFASYLTRVRVSHGYRELKEGTRSLLSHIPLIGKPAIRLLTYLKEKIKSHFLSPNYFEDLGLYYIGPVDGNDYKKTAAAISHAKKLSKCTVVHLKTVKGKGYEPAENSPDGYHSISGVKDQESSFHAVMADELLKIGDEDKSTVAVTAAMGLGTGLASFGERYPERYFDVGIAEEHALTFSAGLAASGLKPFVSIYSTFLQRGYDSIIHDICLQELPVKLLVDRASLSVSDGATHHGIFDVAFLSHIPNMNILSPITYGSLRAALREAHALDVPIAVRYPNKKEDKRVSELFYPDGDYENFGVRLGFDTTAAPDCLFITYGAIITRVIDAAEILKNGGYSVGIILLERLKPLDTAFAEVKKYISSAKKVLFAEEGIKNGGVGMILGSMLSGRDASKYEIAAIDDNFASPTSPVELYEHVGLSPERLAEKILSETLEK